MASLQQIGDKLANQRDIIQQIGLGNWLRLTQSRLLRTMTGNSRLVRLDLPATVHPLYFRSGTTDFYVIHQIFVQREYSCFDDLKDPGLILDCGANGGYSSAYFLSRFPGSTVIAV